jgi:hypothetical protein
LEEPELTPEMTRKSAHPLSTGDTAVARPCESLRPEQRRWRTIGIGSLACWCALLAGCSAITNPVANGVPARLLPEELLAESKEETEPIPLAWLRVKPPEVYRLDTGDILGVYIEGALGDRNQVPPIHFPQVADLPPSIGYPIPVGESGDVPLPLVKRVNVRGLSLEEAQDKISTTYTGGTPGAKQFLKPEEARILVTLVRPRQVRILLVREDSPNQRVNVNDPDYRLFGSAPYLSNRGQGSGSIIELPETEADVLSVLAQTGGLPGPTASNEVIIYRGFKGLEGYDLPPEWNEDGLRTGQSRTSADEPRTIRIPLRILPGKDPPFDPNDIHLQSGDIVFIPSRETDVYYTGGLMPAREVPLPRDYDLRVVEAILRVGGPVLNGGQFLGGFAGQAAFARGLGNPNPSLLTILRKTPSGGQIPIRVNLNRALRDNRENLLVMPGDVLLLQETPAEAVARYVSEVFGLNVVAEMFNRGSGFGTVNIQGP